MADPEARWRRFSVILSAICLVLALGSYGFHRAGDIGVGAVNARATAVAGVGSGPRDDGFSDRASGGDARFRLEDQPAECVDDAGAPATCD